MNYISYLVTVESLTSTKSGVVTVSIHEDSEPVEVQQYMSEAVNECLRQIAYYGDRDVDPSITRG